MPTPSVLSAEQREFVASARTAILATTTASGRPRLVPICFVLDGDVVVSPLDEKPKIVEDPRSLARVRDIRAQPRIDLLVHRWDEDWSRLGWVRLEGTATLLEPGDAEHDAAIVPLRSKYPQYATQAIDRRPMIRIQLADAAAWGALDGGDVDPDPAS
jgi:PPOX class probable F420-dependent enzyme